LIEEKEGLLKGVFGLSKQLGRIAFPIIVKESTGFDVIPINPQDSSDKNLIDKLNGILRKFLKTSIF
jgi:predicted CoA-binding protein